MIACAVVLFMIGALLLFGCAVPSYDVIFKDNPCISPLKKYRYVTNKPIEIFINKKKITIPKNFKTDLASIPRFLWSLYSPATSEFMGPSILHDYLYEYNNGYSRKQADYIFYNALISHKVNRLIALKFLLAVRLFGYKVYH